MKYSVFLLCVLLKYSASIVIDSRNTVKYEFTESTYTETIKKMPALGRVADLGDLYDARTETFMGISLYKKKIKLDDKDIVHCTDIAHVEFNYIRTDSIIEKMQKLEITGELKVSLAGGLVPLYSGSGKYIIQKKKTWKSVQTSLFYKLKTKQDHLKIFSNKSKDAVDMYVLNNVDATHVVVGMEWGANVVLSFEKIETDFGNSRTSEGQLANVLDFVVKSVSDAANVNIDVSVLEKSKPFSIDLYSDFNVNETPQTIKESINFIRNIPRLIENENNGRGKIIEYILMPIATVRQVLTFDTNERNNKKIGFMVELGEKRIDQMIQIFQEMTDSSLQINDAYNEIVKWTFMVPENEVEDILKKKRDFDFFSDQLKINFSEEIVKYRQGNSSAEKLNALIGKYHNSHWTPTSVEQLLKIYEPSLRRFRLMNLFDRFNARFLDRRTDKYKIVTMYYHREIRIISLNLSIDIQSDFVRKVVTLLETEIKKGFDPKNKSKPIIYYIHDDPDCAVPYINVYLEGHIVDSFHANETEYVLLISAGGNVSVINSVSYDVIVNYVVKEFETSVFAVVKDTLYCIDTTKGSISSTHVKNILTVPEDGIKWEHVGSFPKEKVATKSNTAVNGSSFYFISSNGVLYKYKINSKTVTREKNSIKNICAKSAAASSMIISNGMLYINTDDQFCSYDGVDLKSSKPSPYQSIRSGLFESKLGICRVGSQEKVDANDSGSTINAIECYNVTKTTWSTVGNTNYRRDCPGVATTQTGVVIVGGSEENKPNNSESFISAEIFNEDTQTARYFPTPLSIVKGCYFAFSIWY